MDGFKEFQGKSLDDAISAACSYFDATRERLEIDIIQDSKSGIFGLVGARKAKIKARRVQMRSAVEDILGRKRESAPAADAHQATGTPSAAEETAPRKNSGANGKKNHHKPREKTPAPHRTDDAPAPAAARKNTDSEKKSVAEAEAPSETLAVKPGSSHRRRDSPEQEAKTEAKPPAEPILSEEALAEDLVEDMLHVPFEELDADRLRVLSLEVVQRLVEPIVGVVELQVVLDDCRVNVRVECGDDSGLLIGREGQTLASLQYLASRMVSRGMNAAVRVQLDAGEYRTRQDEKLRDMALILAQKVRATGKAHSTRPLSSYHRRIVHVTLQDAPDVQTRSSGDGALKRVVVQRKKH